jgi:hypothetical protein
MDLLKGEYSSSTETCATSTLDGNQVTDIEVVWVTDIKEEEDLEPTTIPVIKTEPEVSCVPVVSVTDILYKLYPELPACITGCPYETRI